MQHKLNRKNLGRIGLLYGAIISIINYLGYRIASSSNMPIVAERDVNIWIAFLDEHSVFFAVMSIFAFAGPAVICILYGSLCDEKKIERRIINIPIVYSLIGSMGWALWLLMETVALLYLHIRGILNMKVIFISSALNMSQICLFITTFAFLILDVLHRKLVLPLFFPEGKISQKEGVIHLSSKGLILIFYLSVGVFPIVFLLSTLYSESVIYGFGIQIGVILTIAIVIVFGIVMTFFFSDHFSNPLIKLGLATKAMSESNYDVKVDVISSDEFGELADNFNDMAVSLRDKSKRIVAISDSIIRGMAIMVEQRDNSTGGHISRTSDCVRVFMNYLDDIGDDTFTPEFKRTMIKAAPMHDLGKIAVDDEVLRKPGKFTDEEYEIMKKHAAAGAVIVERVLGESDDEEFKHVATNVAHYHHEKWNGKGYPEGIKEEEIPVEARIMALADVFDALVSKRCYKDKMSYDKAFGIIENDLGTHFDPALGKLFLECRPRLESLYDSYVVEE